MELRPEHKQTEVGVVPEDWDVVLLDSVARRGSGHTPDKKHRSIGEEISNGFPSKTRTGLTDYISTTLLRRLHQKELQTRPQLCTQREQSFCRHRLVSPPWEDLPRSARGGPKGRG